MPETPIPQTVYLLILGNPVDGFTHYVFDDMKEAEWCAHSTTGDYWIKPLTRGELGWD